MEPVRLTCRHRPTRHAAIEILTFGQVSDPACDSRSAMDELHIWPKCLSQLILQQREVGAGEHHRVDFCFVRFLAQCSCCSVDRCLGIFCSFTSEKSA